MKYLTQSIDDIFPIGCTVIARGDRWRPNPLWEYKRQVEEANKLAEPIPIDMDWCPGLWHTYPHKTCARLDPRDYRTEGTKVFLNKGDRLTILSSPESCPAFSQSYIFKVRDKDGNEYFMPCSFFEKE